MNNLHQPNTIHFHFQFMIMQIQDSDYITCVQEAKKGGLTNFDSDLARLCCYAFSSRLNTRRIVCHSQGMPLWSTVQLH